MSVNQAYNFKQVDGSLSTAGILTRDQLALVGDEGYEAVINLLPDTSEYAIDDEPSIIESQGVIYESIPVDFSHPTLQDYQVFEKYLQALAGKKILLHCAANYRVSAFYAIYGYINLGWSEVATREFISSTWNIDEHPVWRVFVNTMLDVS